MSKYYPAEYYSLASAPSGQTSNPVKKLARKLRTRYAVFDVGLIERLVYALFPHGPLRSLSGLGLTRASRILDVGCGVGSYLYGLREIGFGHLLGVDAYLKQERIEYENGLTVLRKSIHEVEGEWDLVMLHHCLEHLADQLEALQSVTRLHSEEGVCLIRMPTVSSHAWRHYGVNWVQLDAPRHFVLHSTESIRTLAKRAGLHLVNVVYDSTGFQFWASEQYQRDIPLASDRSYLVSRRDSAFSRSDIASFRRKARDLNARSEGDQAAFYFSKRGRTPQRPECQH